MKAMILALTTLVLTSTAFAETVAELRAGYFTGYDDEAKVNIRIEQLIDGSRMWKVSTYDGETGKTAEVKVIAALVSDTAADGNTEVKLSNGMGIVCINQGFMAPGTPRKKNPCTLSANVRGQARTFPLYLDAGISAGHNPGL